MTGAPPMVKTSDFTMLPKGVPMLAAASSALRAVLASAITCAVRPGGGERRLHPAHRRMGERVRRACHAIAGP